MKSTSLMTFREKEMIIKYVLLKVKEQQFWEVQESSVLERLVNYGIDSLDGDELRVFKSEFMENTTNLWWLDYYSKSTFYRIKNRAMTRFIDCLKL